MGYVLRRNEDGKYVRPSGMTTSYTTDITKARQFPTLEAANRERCGNETALPVEALASMSGRF
jgi:hypothetical protein